MRCRAYYENGCRVSRYSLFISRFGENEIMEYYRRLRGEEEKIPNPNSISRSQMKIHLPPWAAVFVFLCFTCVSAASAKQRPYAQRISCGAHKIVTTSSPGKTTWLPDFGYTGGIASKATRPAAADFTIPRLKTLRLFPLSEGTHNCYVFKRIPVGVYLIRVFFGHQKDISTFDLSVQGTLVATLKPDWTTRRESLFSESLVSSISDSCLSVCFHNLGSGDPAVLSLEILELGSGAYNVGRTVDQIILVTKIRVSFGVKKASATIHPHRRHPKPMSSSAPSIAVYGVAQWINTLPNYYRIITNSL